MGIFSRTEGLQRKWINTLIPPKFDALMVVGQCLASFHSGVHENKTACCPSLYKKVGNIIQSFGQKSFGQKSFGQKSFGQKSFGQTSFEQTSFRQTSFEQTSFGQTTLGQATVSLVSTYIKKSTFGLD
jgi:hypothetical protein